MGVFCTGLLAGKRATEWIAVHPPSTSEHPALKARSARTRPTAAPAEDRLPLLPSGPDGVHGSSSRGTRSSTPFGPTASERRGLGRGFGPAGADCRYRAPLVPRLARPGDDTATGFAAGAGLRGRGYGGGTPGWLPDCPRACILSGPKH